jgi:hypothetical protein
MQLPADILVIIREYSKPVTRPDWRTIKPLAGHVLHNDLYNSLWENEHITFKLYKRVFTYLKNTRWGELYMFTRLWGIEITSLVYGTPIPELYKISGMSHAQDHFNTYA